MLTASSSSSDCCERFKQVLVFFGGWLAWGYTLAILIAELVIGGKAATVVHSFYSFEIDHISIDAFCRDIYKDTKSVATTYILIAAICFIWFLLRFLQWLCWIPRRCEVLSAQPCIPFEVDSLNFLHLGALGASAISTITAVAYGAFLTWKLHDLSTECRDFWNVQVSPDFLAIFGYCQTLLIATAVVGGVWCIIFLIGACMVVAESAH